MSRRAKIVCTLGPATDTPERVRELVDAGMDIARFNLSHGSYDEHAARFEMVRDIARASGRAVGILVDLQGPKIRLGTFESGPVMLTVGDPFTITTDPDVVGTARRASTTYRGLADDAKVGTRILIDDGKVALEITAVDGTEVHTTVVYGGPVSNHKGLNLPDVAVSVPAMSEKDIADLRWAMHHPTDLVALSFVRSPRDVDAVRAIMAEEGVSVPVLAKIEKPQAVSHLPEIVEAFDGIMVARGDLGVELPLEDVPIVQKRAVALAREVGKPVIVATQMLESMVSAPRPTRAEASDVANAVLDGADALMLSGETSIGEYPIETVATMARIIEATERQALNRLPALMRPPTTIGNAIARAATLTGANLHVKFLVAFTQSGETARRLAAYRCEIPLLAFTPDPDVRNLLALSWGLETFIVPTATHTDEMVRQVDRALLEIGRCSEGDLVCIVFGLPVGRTGATNTMRLHRIGQD